MKRIDRSKPRTLENFSRVRAHYHVSAHGVPLQAAKPFATEKPKHLVEDAVHVFQGYGDHPEEQFRFFHRLWEHEIKLGIPAADRTRTAVPLFGFVERLPASNRSSKPLQFLISLESKLPSFEDHLKGLDRVGKAKAHAQFQDFLRRLSRRGIKPGTTSPLDYFVHVKQTKKKGTTLQFVLISPKGGVVFEPRVHPGE